MGVGVGVGVGVGFGVGVGVGSGIQHGGNLQLTGRRCCSLLPGMGGCGFDICAKRVPAKTMGISARKKRGGGGLFSSFFPPRLRT